MCDHIGCLSTPTFTVCLQVKVANRPVKDGPLIGIMKVCKEHNDVKWSDIVIEESWQSACKFVLDAGYASPSRAHSRVVVVPIIDETSTSN